jgi:hypothetical protein
VAVWDALTEGAFSIPQFGVSPNLAKQNVSIRVVGCFPHDPPRPLHHEPRARLQSIQCECLFGPWHIEMIYPQNLKVAKSISHT